LPIDMQGYQIERVELLYMKLNGNNKIIIRFDIESCYNVELSGMF
jgi:hypothetical protein